MQRSRQFLVTHARTGEQTVVMGSETQYSDGTWGWSTPRIADVLGYRDVVECTVTAVPHGREYRLPFDTLPLVIRRATPEAT